MKSLGLMLLTLCALNLMAGDAHMEKVINGDHRSADNKARDAYRNPAQTLAFFGIKPDMTVVESWPGGGWYTEILAPYLKDKGKLIAATYNRDAETQQAWQKRLNENYDKKFVADKDKYGDIDVVSLAIQNGPVDIAPAGTVDMILDFRNAHNWLQWGSDAMVQSWHKALKVGGVVGITDHRLAEDMEYNARTGYIHEKQLIEAMEKHGFKLAGKSDINANAKDTRNYPRGVWSLPPSLALGEQDRDKYVAIGESDRMTMKFVKQ